MNCCSGPTRSHINLHLSSTHVSWAFASHGLREPSLATGAGQAQGRLWGTRPSPTLARRVARPVRIRTQWVPHTCVHVWDSIADRYTRRVPHNLQRYYGGRDFHFVAFSCYQRLPFFNNRKRRYLLLRLLEETRQACRHRGGIRGHARARPPAPPCTAAAKTPTWSA